MSNARQSRLERIRTDLARGKSLREIERSMGLSRGALSHWLRRQQLRMVIVTTTERRMVQTA